MSATCSIVVCNKFVGCNRLRLFCWIDPEWPKALKHLLARLWSIYEHSNTDRIKEKIRNAQLFQNLFEEKIGWIRTIPAY
jgi:hypothetical protein